MRTGTPDDLTTLRTGLTMVLCVVASAAACLAQAPATQPADTGSAPADALIRRLRNSDSGSEDLEQRITRLMYVSRERLARLFDTGENTQRIQIEIIKELETAIDIAKRHQSRASSSSASPQQGEKRRAGRRQERKEPRTGKGKPGEQDPQEAPAEHGDETARAAEGGQLTEHRRGWGHLPERDREEVIQGFKEEYLRKYAELIEEYYRSLSEEAEE